MERNNGVLQRQMKAAAAMSIGLLMLSPLHAAEKDIETPAGSYEVRICKTACLATSDEGLLVKGHLVLFPGSIEKHDLDRLRSLDFRRERDAAPNACFVLEKMAASYAGYAGIDKSGLAAWSVTGDELIFDLMRSPDAGYRVSVRATTKGFEGTGRSWGVGVAAPRERGPEYVMLRRTGESDIRKCESGSAED